VDSSFLKEQAGRCCSLAENTDQFTKRRLLDLAAKYDDGLGLPSRAIAIPTRFLESRILEKRSRLLGMKFANDRMR
jgi:hypothetical protein